MALKDKIRVRRDTTANFTSTNPVLSLGEISFDTTTKQFKVGDGTSTWTSLAYADAAATASAIAAYAQPLGSDLAAIVDPHVQGKKYQITDLTLRVSSGQTILDLKPAIFIDASTGVYTDAGTTLATTDGQSIYRINDQSGNNRYVEQATSNKRPTLQTVAGKKVWRMDGSNDILKSVAFNMPQPCTVYAVFQQVGTNAGRLFDANTVNGAILNVPTELQKGLFALSANVPASVCSSVADIYSCVFDGSDSLIECGLREAVTGNPGTVGWADGVTIGGAGNEADGFHTAADWYYLLAFPKVHTLEERNLVRSWLYSNLALAPFLHCIGDSLTSGVGAGTGEDYPSQMEDLLNETVTLSNTGVGGITAATIASDTLRNISQYTSALRRNVICIWAGTNDLLADTSAADTYDELKTLWAAARTAGHRVVAATVIARGNFSGPQETARVALNALIKSDPTLYDALADLAFLPQFDTQADCSNTTYYNADTIHLVAAGYAVVAQAFADQVNYLLGLPPKFQGTAYALDDHSHGNITNDGKIGSTANLPLITGASGTITTGSFGTTANTFCQGNDSRVVNAAQLNSDATFSGVVKGVLLEANASSGFADVRLTHPTGNSYRFNLPNDDTLRLQVSPDKFSASASNIMQVSSSSVQFFVPLVASGSVSVGPITKSALLALTPSATAGEYRITDSTPSQRRAYPDGTNWRYADDDSLVSATYATVSHTKSVNTSDSTATVAMTFTVSEIAQWRTGVFSVRCGHIDHFSPNPGAYEGSFSVECLAASPGPRNIIALRSAVTSGLSITVAFTSNGTNSFTVTATCTSLDVPGISPAHDLFMNIEFTGPQISIS
jgi:acyl-CoA thioesterase-1